MARLKEFGEALATAWRRMMRPAVSVPAVLLFVLAQVFGLGTAAAALAILEGPGGVERLTEYSGLLMVVGIGFILLAPAVASGLMSLAKAAVEQEAGEWRDFWRGLGTYYWRVAGFYLLLLVVSALASGPLGVYGDAVRTGSLSRSMQVRMQIVAIVASYLATMWTAAAALDGARAFRAIGRAATFAWTNPYLLVPAVILQSVSGYVVSWVSGAALSTMEYGVPTVSPGMGWARFLNGVISGAASGYLYMFFMLLYFGLYKMRSAPPPLDPDQGPKE